MGSTFSITVDLSSVDAAMDFTVEQAAAAARPAAQAGAQVLYDEVKRNVARIKRHTGNLASSIYQAYSPDRSPPGVAVYHVSWNAKKAPHGHLVEFGHLQRYVVERTRRGFITRKDLPLSTPKQVAAKPFVRPAAARLPDAEEAMRTRFLAELVASGAIS
jgi:hypothetical protein